MISVKNVNFSYSNKSVLKDISLEFEKNRISILIGANGSGKSTLLKLCSRVLNPSSGSISLDGDNIHNIDTKDVAKKLSMLPQDDNINYDLTLFNLVKMGRYPYQTLFSTYSKDDEKYINDALKITDTISLKDENISLLSGGQRQRARIAMLLAQDTELMLLDEPTNHLDLKYKIEILELLKKLNKEQNRTIVLVLHDINLAARYADTIIALKDGQIVSKGNSKDVIKEDIIEDVFGVKSKVVPCPIFDTPNCIVY